MNLSEEIIPIIGQPENQSVAYKAVLPPARSLAQMIAAFANTNGGYIVLGVVESDSEIIINGLSEDFQANAILHRASDLLLPRSDIDYDYISYQGKRLYVIKVAKSDAPILLEGKLYTRKSRTIVLNEKATGEREPIKIAFVKSLTDQIINYRISSTGAKSKFLDHYLSVLHIIADLSNILYPESPEIYTTIQEGKILIRILFSSCADNFETYLSDLLYEIYLANPDTLKSSQQVTIKEVLDCADIQEFVLFCAKKKLSKLQRGSVKGFVAENAQIRDLNVVDSTKEIAIEKLLQVRHLYAHRNGIVDEKFLQFYPGQYRVNDEHQLTIVEMMEHLSFLLAVVNEIDEKATVKYQLATL